MDTFVGRVWGVADEEKVREMAIGLTEPPSGSEEVLPMPGRFRLRIVRSFGGRGENRFEDVSRRWSSVIISVNMS